MDFKSFSFPRKQFPRFDNACAKSLEIQKRYDNLVREGKCLKEKKNVKIILCKRKGDTKFPVDINFLFSETYYSPNVQKGNTIDSIEAFSRTLKQNDESVCVLIVDSKEKNKISHLWRKNIHLLVIKDDDKIEIAAMYQSMNVIIAARGNLKSEIDNVLERISLAPLKQICEHCYTIFKEKTSTKLDKNVPGYEIERKMLVTDVGQEHQSTSTSSGNLADTSLDLHARQSYLKETYSLKVSSITTQHINGSEIIAETSGQSNTNQYTRKSKQEITKRDVPNKTPTIIYKRTRSHLKAHDKVKSHLNSDLNGYKNSKESAGSALRESNTEKIRKRPIENDDIKKDKKRKEDILQQTSSKDRMHEEDPERLLEAILAVYGMSNAPESERPNVPKQSKRVNEQVKDELFKICPTIKRMGYRYRTFHIYAVKPVRLEDERIRNNKIRSVLKKYKMFPYEIAHCNDKIQEMMYTGARIEAQSDTHYSLRTKTVSRPQVSKGGTLGGFVKTNEKNQQYCLLSKHVTEHCDNIFCVENGNNEFLGHILSQTNYHIPRGLDISAALMKDSVNEESTKFKDTQGTPLKGILHEYDEKDEDDICKSGQSVHIHGAMTKPGKGEITMPIVHNGLTSPLIQVEDIDEVGAVHFAEKGDSGVVMCVEDPDRKHIYALGMVMGDVPDDSPRRKYLALPLSKGIQQIEEQTNTRLELM